MLNCVLPYFSSWSIFVIVIVIIIITIIMFGAVPVLWLLKSRNS